MVGVLVCLLGLVGSALVCCLFCAFGEASFNLRVWVWFDYLVGVLVSGLCY